MQTKVYQAYYRYAFPQSDLNHSGKLYLNKEDCQKEIDEMSIPTDTSFEAYQKSDIPSECYEYWVDIMEIMYPDIESADIIEIEVY